MRVKVHAMPGTRIGGWACTLDLVIIWFSYWGRPPLHVGAWRSGVAAYRRIDAVPAIGDCS